MPQPLRRSLLCTVLLAAATVPAARAQTATVNVDTTTPIRLVDEKVFGLNTAVWDGAYPDPQTVLDLQDMQTRFLRYPGGSSSDDYNWQTNQSQVEMQPAGATDFDTFAASALAIGAQVVITANYGTGTPQEAAAWVTYSNVTKGYGFKYWEVGNECYGTWEDDVQARLMTRHVRDARRPVYPGDEGRGSDDKDRSGGRSRGGLDSERLLGRPGDQPANGTKHNGWTPVMLSTMASLGVLPDFLIYHPTRRTRAVRTTRHSSRIPRSPGPRPQPGSGKLTDYVGAARGRRPAARDREQLGQHRSGEAVGEPGERASPWRTAWQTSCRPSSTPWSGGICTMAQAHYTRAPFRQP